MVDILRIGLVFALVLVLLRKKLGIGYALMIAASVLMALYAMTPAGIATTLKAVVFSDLTLKLLLSLSLIMMFELIMRENNVLRLIMESMRSILKKKKAVIISMPLLIGMLPSVGGAYFSAPMVEEATREMDLTAEEKTFINYWYRHPWEYVLPLYPGIILASVLTRVGEGTFIVMNLAYAVGMVVIGLFYGLNRARGSFPAVAPQTRSGFTSLIPIVLLLLMVIVFRVELHYALMGMIVMLLLFFRYKPRDMVRVARHGISREVIMLIIGVMMFKEALEHSGAVANLSAYFTTVGIPVLPLVFLLPFTVGFLTGITVGAVGSTFPLILSVAGNDVHLLSFAFASGFIGVLLSPVHVCLILTREYFHADMWAVYRKIIPASAAVLLVAIAEYILTKRIGHLWG